MASKGLIGKAASVLGQKLEDPQSREAARRFLSRVTGEEQTGSGLAETPDPRRAGDELRDRVEEALGREREADLRAALREAISEYDRGVAGR